MINASSLGSNPVQSPSNTLGFGQNDMRVQFMGAMFSMLQMMMTMMMGIASRGNNGSQNYPPSNNYPYNYPDYQNKPTELRGSAGLVGDPRFLLLTPELQNVSKYAPLKDFQSGLKEDQVVTLLGDTDNGGFTVNGKAIKVDEARPDSIGMANLDFNVGGQMVKLANNGDISVDGNKVGNITDDGFVNGIQLNNGAVLGTADRVDDAAGNKAERFVIRNGEYEVTAALRQVPGGPNKTQNNYYDVNFEELTANAAKNATGYQTPVDGFGNIGIADLLRLNKPA